ncbi:hypothetical protein AML30_05165 [Escherichia coli]|nr:hypothetical protein AML19_15790 [Escherichia coli]KYS73386.1 hypothetical protein AML30_05165 [Escherichia coli]TJU59732.1 hypothetical protein C9Y81_12035 [Escherichia coli]
MLPSETMIWQPEFTDKTLSRKPGAVHFSIIVRCRSVIMEVEFPPPRTNPVHLYRSYSFY